MYVFSSLRGIVAGIFDQLGIAEVVDKKIPKIGHHKLTHGEFHVLKLLISSQEPLITTHP